MNLSPINLGRLHSLKEVPCRVVPDSVVLGVSYKKEGELLGEVIGDYLCKDYVGKVYVIEGQGEAPVGAISYKISNMEGSSVHKATVGLVFRETVIPEIVADALHQVTCHLCDNTPTTMAEAFLDDDFLIKLFKDQGFTQIGSLGAYQWFCKDFK